ISGTPESAATQQHEPGRRAIESQSRAGDWQQDLPQLAELAGGAWASQQDSLGAWGRHWQTAHWQASDQASAPSPCTASARAASQIRAVLRVLRRIMAIICTLPRKASSVVIISGVKLGRFPSSPRKEHPMSRLLPFAALLWTLALPPFLTAEDKVVKDGVFEPLFDGKTLEGWSGNEKFWSVKDGCITGQTTADNKTDGNTFLIWKDKVSDFELRVKFKIVGGNSGIQYRSTDKGNHVVHGYQADIATEDQYMGILYEEGRRGILAQRGNKVEITAKGEKKVVGKTEDSAAIPKDIKKEDWN